LGPSLVALIDHEMEVPHMSIKALHAMLAKVSEPDLCQQHKAVLRQRFIDIVEGELWQIDAWLFRCFVALDTVRSAAMVQFAIDLLRDTGEVLSRISAKVDSEYAGDAELKACFFPTPVAHWLPTFTSIRASSGPIDVNVAELVQFKGKMMLSPVKVFQPSLRQTLCALVIADPSLPDYPIVAFTPEFQNLTGYPDDQIFGRNYRFLQDPAYPLNPTHRAKIRNVCTNNNAPWSYAVMLRHQRYVGPDRFVPFECLMVLTKIIVDRKIFLLAVLTDLSLVTGSVKETDVVSIIDKFLDFLFVVSNGVWMNSLKSAFKIQNIWKQEPVSLEDVARISVNRTSRRSFARLLSRIPVEVDENLTDVWVPITTEEHRALVSAGKEFESTSQGHPWTCTPCKFNAYSARGCDKGQNCKYCHALHVPRRFKHGAKKKSNHSHTFAEYFAKHGTDSGPQFREHMV